MSSKFRFRQHDNIGVADAEQDHEFLRRCFVDNGDLSILSNVRDPRRIVLGRTGAGKTALLLHLLNSQSGVIELKPESLALAYISNSTILQFVHQLGVNLNIFFKLLWRHVFTVEILKTHFDLDSERKTLNFIESIAAFFGGKKPRHAQALEYLQKWGSKFWEETDYRIRELTTKLEGSLKASLGNSASIPFSVNAGGTISEEERAEIIHRAQHVVNDVQIRQLSDMIELIDEVLDDRQRTYFIVIDRLDEDWVEDKLRLLLIRALIETVRDFGKVRHAKIVVALRYDLLDRVVRLTRGAGFQEEKYESLYLPLDWTKKSLTTLLDSRIDKLVKSRYTTAQVTHRELLPSQINRRPAIDYIVERTLMRPRDIILFFNLCIALAKDTPKITAQMVRQAEGEYSRLRLRSLADEWHSTYPNLLAFSAILKTRPPQFALEDFSDDDCIALCLSGLEDICLPNDELTSSAHRFLNNEIDAYEFRRGLASVFYRVGLVGLKLENYEAPSWSTASRRSISISEIRNGTRITVHPCFWRALGINDLA